MTLEELEQRLEDLDAVIQIHAAPRSWVVLLYAPDDPASALYVTQGRSLQAAVNAAFAEWESGDNEVEVISE